MTNVKKIPTALVHRRLELVSTLMLKFPESGQVKRACMNYPDPDVRMGSRTVDRYMARVRDAWATDLRMSLRARKAKHMRALARLRNKAEAAGDLKAAAMIAFKEAEMDGAFEVDLTSDDEADQNPLSYPGSWAVG